MDGSTWVERRDHAAARMFDGSGGGVVLHLGSGAYHGVNPVGALVWESVPDGGATFDDIVATVRARLDDQPPSLPDDLAQFLEDLAARDLIRVRPSR